MVCRVRPLLAVVSVSTAFAKFVLGEDQPQASENGTQHTDVQPAACESGTQHKLKHRLIERCDNLSDEVCLSSLNLFEAILMKPTNEIVHSLILQDLLTRSYWRQTEGESIPRVTPGNIPHVTPVVFLSQTLSTCGDVQTSGATQRIDMQDNSPDILTNSQYERGGDTGVEVGGGKSSVVMITDGGGDSGDVILMNGDVPGMTCDVTDEGRVFKEDKDTVSDEDTAAWVFCLMKRSRRTSRQTLAMTPTSETHTDSSLIHRPSADSLVGPRGLWNYNVNLQLTSVVSCLALLPHPNIHEYLLNPLLPLLDNCRTLPVILVKVAADVEHQMKSMPNFQVRLMMARKHLMGMSTNMRRWWGWWWWGVGGGGGGGGGGGVVGVVVVVVVSMYSNSPASPRTPADLTYVELCKLLQTHYEPKPNTILQRYNFYSAYRKQEQSIDVAKTSHSADECHYKDAQCRYCHKDGHIMSNCFAKQKAEKGKRNRTHQLTAPIQECVPSEHTGATFNMFSMTGPRPDPIVTQIQVDGKTLLMEVDTGATLSTISEETLHRHWRNSARPNMRSTKDTLRTYTGQCVKIMGVINVMVETTTGDQHLLLLMVVPGSPVEYITLNTEAETSTAGCIGQVRHRVYRLAPSS
ncbi:hypothetical protein LSAT2_017614 [Lamellibrachia satsuma]|nr:hypothetical protein LSAT2_017614 [Lamellibrachia satsuma]